MTGHFFEGSIHLKTAVLTPNMPWYWASNRFMLILLDRQGLYDGETTQALGVFRHVGAKHFQDFDDFVLKQTHSERKHFSQPNALGEEIRGQAKRGVS